MQRLAKWKEERDLKKKLAAKSKKPEFKVSNTKGAGKNVNEGLKFKTLPKV